MDKVPFSREEWSISDMVVCACKMQFLCCVSVVVVRININFKITLVFCYIGGIIVRKVDVTGVTRVFSTRARRAILPPFFTPPSPKTKNHRPPPAARPRPSAE